MTIRVLQGDLFIHNIETRIPFRYGITTMTALPHLFVAMQGEIDGQRQIGFAAEGLPPKWFTKNPETPFQADLNDMFRVIQQALTHAVNIGSRRTVFALWQELYRAQEEWATAEELPPLLWGFGVSLVERAIIDAFCRSQNLSFAEAVQSNAFGIHLGDIHAPLADCQPADFLSSSPSNKIVIRHTVGLADPLTDDEISPEERVTDGLPQSLAASIQAYSLTHFKIKIGGNQVEDFARLERINRLFHDLNLTDYAFTLDGNEQYRTVDSFREFWNALTREPKLTDFLTHLLFVEQPFYRDIALSQDVGEQLKKWIDRPSIIIDESDATLNSLTLALQAGYCGTSHKNCKGVFKGIANACLIRHLQQTNPAQHYTISGEDLANMGPIALLQDLAVLATLGIKHAERNGHHYFAGLSMLPQELQENILTEHHDLYRRFYPESEKDRDVKGMQSFATVQIVNGQADITSVLRAPFGLNFEPDLSPFTPLHEWQFESLKIS